MSIIQILSLIPYFVFQMLTYLMVARVAQLCPGAVLTKLDKLVEPLKMTVTTKVKANAVKQVCYKGVQCVLLKYW